MITATELLVWGVVVHAFFDLFIQNQWMADNKTNWKHPAAWVHSGSHFIGLLLVFPPLWALAVAVTHFLIDLREPLVWWRTKWKQTNEGPIMMVFGFWQDQAAHLLVLAIAALACAKFHY